MAPADPEILDKVEPLEDPKLETPFDDLGDAEDQDQIVHEVQDSEVPCFAILGPAGSGKTTILRGYVERSPEKFLFTASTGIAAVNMGTGVTTIHTALKFSNLPSLRQALISGRLVRTLLAHMKAGKEFLVLDEISMFCAPALDIVHEGLRQAGNRGDNKPMSLIVCGDWNQLPPVPDDKDPSSAKFAFQADCWRFFQAEGHTTKLTHIYRQTDPEFLAALAALRRGDGLEARDRMMKTQVEWAHTIDERFAGTTIMATNKNADQHNFVMLTSLEGQTFGIPSYRWHNRGALGPNQPKGWDQIPDQLQVKVGALVMILANKLPDFSYVNGDCGILVGFGETGSLQIKLHRTGQVVEVPMLMRFIEQSSPPSEFEKVSKNDWPKFDPRGMTTKELWEATWAVDHGTGAMRQGKTAWWNKATESWVVGMIFYAPVRLAWATTVHRSQGLTLDRVQIDMVTSAFIGEPGMMYVAASRCRTAQGTRLVGSPDVLARRTKIDQRVIPWL